MNRAVVVATILGLILGSFSTAASAATFVVNSNLDEQDAAAGNGLCATASGNCTLRAAISEANALVGLDVITLPAGTYTTTLVAANEDANAGGDFDITSDVTINGASSATTMVQAAGTAGVATERVFHLRAAGPKVLNDLTIRYGGTTGTFVGAGVLVEAGAVIATLNRVVIANNKGAANGGGLAISDAVSSITTLNACTVENNSIGGTVSSGSNGAGMLLLGASSTLNINGSTITGNTISNQGSASAAGIYSTGILNITNSVVSNNTVTSVGNSAYAGGINTIGGMTMIQGSTISGNVSTSMGGGGSGFAAGISNQDGTLNLVDSIVSGNIASSFHAGIRTLASLAVTTTTISNSTISNNSAVGQGGGVANLSRAGLDATTNITRSTLQGNSSNGSPGLAGGLENRSSSTGLVVVNVINSTISGNTAVKGAGVHNTEATTAGTASINFNYSTIAANTAATNGGGVFQDGGGSIKLKNSIVADNAAPAGPDISGTVTSQGYNLVENISGGTFAVLGGDLTGTDPQLGPLANNGGGTLTQRPAPSSLSIDSIPIGTSDCGVAVTTSQNGIARPQHAGCDKGAVEVDPQLIFRDGFDGTGNIGAPLIE